MHLQAQQAAHSVSGIKITNRLMEAWAVPAPHLCICGNSTRLGHIQPPRSPGELGGVFWIYCSIPQTWLPSSTEGFWSDLLHFSTFPQRF